jgi:hypothetical protein
VAEDLVTSLLSLSNGEEMLGLRESRIRCGDCFVAVAGGFPFSRHLHVPFPD